MKKTLTRFLAVMLLVMLAFPRVDASAFNENAIKTKAQTEAKDESQTDAKYIKGKIYLKNIDKYGNVFLSISKDDFLNAGYYYGDIVKIKILGKKYRVPVVSNFTDVDAGKPALLVTDKYPNIMLAVNTGDFATSYGIATKEVSEDGTYTWNFNDENNKKNSVKVSLWMKVQGGYLDQYLAHSGVTSNERADYPDLTDAEFANFRQVTTTGMGFGILYRSSSPIDPVFNRNTYADKAMKDAGVTVVLNLNDSEKTAKAFEGFADTYYSTTNFIAINTDIDINSDDFKQKLADGLRFMIDNPGVYAIHCTEGQIRTGFVVALLECLMGAGLDEVIIDYMTSYTNYYGITSLDNRYYPIARGNILSTLKKAFTFTKKDKKKSILEIDLASYAQKYLKKIGLTDDEIKQLKKNLSKNVDYVDREVSVIREYGATTTINLRFYSDQPNIPYIGIKEFLDEMNLISLKSKKDKSGNIVYTNPYGVKAVFDPKAGTLTCDDWAHFHYKAAPIEEATAYKDLSCGLVRISEINFEGKSKKVTFDFKKYGLNTYEINDDIYMSLSLANNVFAELSTRALIWNGNVTYIIDYFSSEEFLAAYKNSSPMMRQQYLERSRPRDLINETFNELCFSIDYFYGHPGVAELDEEISEKGLEQALLDLGSEGQAIVKGLKSSIISEFSSAFMKLFMKYLDDKGHTYPKDMIELYYSYVFSNLSFQEQIEFNYMLENYHALGLEMLGTAITETRSQIWGDENYFEYGNTAVIRLMDFMPDVEGWKDYYEGESDIPEDSLSIVINGLKKASENPKIENIIFDTSYNGGGSSDLCAFITYITTGRDFICMYDRINDQYFTCVYEVDANLDGVYDEKDKEARYDQFNYAVLTSNQGFSCGNYFPFAMQESGAVLIGESTGGGSCSIQYSVMPDFMIFVMSSYQSQLMTIDKESVESGCKPDISLTHETIENEDGSIKYDYSEYFDIENICKLINEWFAEHQGMQEAA